MIDKKLKPPNQTLQRFAATVTVARMGQPWISVEPSAGALEQEERSTNEHEWYLIQI